ncbi:MAG: diguanylate cyclase [Chitinivibrionales bacterium]|nr:diguanylate cyclase [Chitinivibrionales bacterium]
MLIYGDAGIGKSRMMNEIKKHCQLSDMTFIEASCFSTIKKSYSPFIDLLNKSLFLCDEAILNKHGPELKKLLPSHEKLSQILQSMRSDAKTEQRLLSKHITEFFIDLSRTGKNQIVLYLNDIQWIDDESLGIIESLLLKIRQAQMEIGFMIKLILSSRREGFCHVKNMAGQSLLHSIELQPFDQQKVGSFFAAVFGAGRIGKSLSLSIDFITKQVGGNPFFLQEVIRSLVENDTITHLSDCWELLIKPDMIPIPATVHELLVSRYRQLKLTATEQEVVEIMCLINRDISYAELAKIRAVDLLLLQKLEYHEIIRKEIRDGELYFKMHHDLIKEMIIRQIGDIKAVHNEIATKLEQIHAHTLEEQIYALTYHYLHGCNSDKAMAFGTRAIEKALKNFEMKRTVDLCDSLLPLVEHDEEKHLFLLLKKIESGRLLFTVDEIDTLGDEILTRAQKINDSLSMARCLLQIAEAHYRNKRDFISMLGYLERSYEEFTKARDKSGAARALNFIGICYTELDNYPKAAQFHTKSLEIAESINDETIIACNIGNLGIIHAHLGDFKEALNQYKRVLPILMKLNSKQNIALTLNQIGLVYVRLGDCLLAVDYFDKAIAITDEIDMHANKILAMAEKADALLVAGRLKEAVQMGSEAAVLIKKFPVPEETIIRVKTVTAHIEQSQGNGAKALELMNALSNEFTGDGNQAEFNYEIWKINLDEGARQKALNLYRKLYGQVPKFSYKKCIEELQSSDMLKRSDEIDVTQTAAVNDQTINLVVLKKELDAIQEIFRKNDLSSQFQLYETNSQVYNKLKRIVAAFKYLCLDQAKDDAFSYEQKRIVFFQQLLEIIHDLNSNLSLNTLLEKILDASIGMMGAERGFIFLYNQDGVLDIKAARSSEKESLDLKNFKVSQTSVLKVLQTQEPLFITNVADELDLSQCQSIADLELRSIMAAPIGRKFSAASRERRKYPFLSASQRLGVIYLDNRSSMPDANFIGSNLTLFQALVDQASIAIVNTILYESVNIDKLTGLYLRSFFEATLEHELTYCNMIHSHCSVLMIDIDFFKMINDHNGHQAGDEVLRILGGLLKRTLRNTDICGRYGGEEFIIILPNTDLIQAPLVAAKLHQQISQTSFPCGALTVSIGISCFPEHCDGFSKDETRKLLIQNADQALYRAKHNGRNRSEVWSSVFNFLHSPRSTAKQILTGSPIRDYRNVELLLAVIQTISSSIEKEDVLEAVVDLMLNAFDADRGMILGYNEVNKSMEFLVARDKQGDIDTAHCRISTKIVDMVVKLGKDICMNAIEEEHESHSIIDMDIKSIMCVALRYGEQLLGALYIDSQKQIKEFTVIELSFVSAIASQISLLIRLAREKLIN